MSPNLAQCVVLLCIRLIQATLFASDLLWSSVHITSPCPRLFLSATTRFLGKGEKSIACVEWLYKKAVWGVVKSWEFEGNLRCRNILRKVKNPMKWVVSISREYWVYLTLLWKGFKIWEFWGEFWGIETFTGANLVLRPASRGMSGGLALKYFDMIHRVGRTCVWNSHVFSYIAWHRKWRWLGCLSFCRWCKPEEHSCRSNRIGMKSYPPLNPRSSTPLP